MTRSHFFAATLAAGLLFLPAAARAQSAADKSAAEALFAEGRKLMDQGKYAEACKKLEGSQKLDPGAGTLLNLASCYEHNGQTASAWVTYKEAASAAAQRHPDWAQQATGFAAQLEPKLSKLTIEAPKPTQAMVVTRDGVAVEASSFGVAIPVDPGAHVIEATAPGHLPFHTEVAIGESKDAKTVTIPELAVGDVTPPAPAPRGAAQRVVGLTMMGVGGVGVVIGSIFGGMALAKKGDAGNLCTADYTRCSPAGKALVDDAKSTGNISTVVFIAGGAFLAGGLIVWLVAPKSESKVQAAFGAPGANLGVTIGGAF